ncbi:hypothetical protein QQF64_024029 [Cirrhinus molitorella]|uniref:Uncharacterized protein n=1 Tax=Cirrhinus molitorella TaxID=172907 RepID=A0ABR3NKZ0_9TELE
MSAGTGTEAADMLFSIHPSGRIAVVWQLADCWTNTHPCMFQTGACTGRRIPEERERYPQVPSGQDSVLPPTGDANSLSRSVVMYACNRNVDLAIQHGRQRPAGLPHSSSTLIGLSQSKPSSNSLRLSIFTPSVLMISKHADGSAQPVAVSFAETRPSPRCSLSHKSGTSVHRFHLKRSGLHYPCSRCLAHHLRTTTPEDARRGRRSPPARRRPVPQEQSVVRRGLPNPKRHLQLADPVASDSRNCLGVYGNSPSACFIASDGHSLRLYQAIIEAKKLLSELSNPDISKYVGEVFNIISQQSTAKPGCIIELDAITDFQGKETQLLHFSPADALLPSLLPVVEEITQSGRSLLHMWHLQLDAVPVIMGL